MNLHEYQAKHLFREYAVPVPDGGCAETPEQVRDIALRLGMPVVVKAQIHAGGRGKGGGIRLVKTAEEAFAAGKDLLGVRLVTPQTGPHGQMVHKVLVEQGLSIARELYIGITVDRRLGCPVIIASSAGGMEIEEVAVDHPELIIRAAVDPATGCMPMHVRKIVFGLGLDTESAEPVSHIIENLYRLFCANDCLLVEVNPCVITSDSGVYALDAKVQIDDDALFRHPELKSLTDPQEQEPLEAEAARHRLSYIRLDGNVGCMVNGAGLAMATMDIIKLAGAEPANFLDIGGGASAEQVEQAFKILLADKHVRAVLIHIFGGILRCDRVATGIVEAAKRVDVRIPMVVRLEGTNGEEGREILRASGLSFEPAESFEEAARKIAACAGG
jgi:succinyl-CoA synthetase beta subunit